MEIGNKVEKVNGYINICSNVNLLSIPKFITRLAQNGNKNESIHNIQLPRDFCYQDSTRLFIRPLIRDIYQMFKKII